MLLLHEAICLEKAYTCSTITIYVMNDTGGSHAIGSITGAKRARGRGAHSSCLRHVLHIKCFYRNTKKCNNGFSRTVLISRGILSHAAAPYVLTYRPLPIRYSVLAYRSTGSTRPPHIAPSIVYCICTLITVQCSSCI